jgi:hypothetical protein
MTILRQFLIAPSLARLIRKERGGEWVLEGYFPDQPQRRTFVQVEETRSSLILAAMDGATPEEQADVPLTHAQALLAVSHGQVEYLRTTLSVGSHELQAFHFVRPGPLNLVAVNGAPEDKQDLPPMPWFGPEVSTEPAYQRRRLALDGGSDAAEIEVTNAAVNSLLDLLEDRFTTWPLSGQGVTSDEPVADAPPRSQRAAPEPGTETEEETDDLGFEDAVIRELARALQPRRGG